MFWADHILVFVLVVMLPLVGYFGLKKLKLRSEAGQIVNIKHEYLFNIVLQWSLVLILLYIWSHQQRRFSDLGFTFPNIWSVTLIVFIVFGIYLYFTRTVKQLRLDEKYFKSLEEKITPLKLLLPKTIAQRNTFYALSVTAGICEEVLYRGFMLVYFTSYMNVYFAVFVTSILFGIAHAYQGRKGGIETGIIGLLMALIYILTESIWASMVLHAAIDITSGYFSWIVLGKKHRT